MLESAALESHTGSIVRGFLDRTLPKPEWTHEAHLRVGLWHLLHFAPAEALDRLRTGIRLYNEATGVANSDDSGYHETITRLYLVLIADFLHSRELDRDLDELAAELIANRGDRQLPLTFYSEALLMSTKARREWVEPDLQALPSTPGTPA